MTAVHRGRIDRISYLLDMGANPYYPSVLQAALPDRIDRYTATPLPNGKAAEEYTVHESASVRRPWYLSWAMVQARPRL